MVQSDRNGKTSLLSYRHPVSGIPYTGYNKASELAKLMKSKGISVQEANRELGLISENKLSEILKPGNLLKMGYSLQDLMD